MEKKHTYGSLDQEFYLPIIYIYIVIINSYIITDSGYLQKSEREDRKTLAKISRKPVSGG